VDASHEHPDDTLINGNHSPVLTNSGRGFVGGFICQFINDFIEIKGHHEN